MRENAFLLSRERVCFVSLILDDDYRAQASYHTNWHSLPKKQNKNKGLCSNECLDRKSLCKDW